MSTPELVLDRIVLSKDGRRRELTVAEFFAIPLSERIRCVIERTVTFYRGNEEVDRQAALAALRLVRARSVA